MNPDAATVVSKTSTMVLPPGSVSYPATTATTPIVYQLRDIHGLDPVPWWPPAPGWWVMLGGILISIWLIRNYILNSHRQVLTELAWRRDAVWELRALRKRVRQQPIALSASQLSALLRRVAMARYGRDSSAGLTGTTWLKWLEAHDPAGYAWSERGQLLLTLPYAPPEAMTAAIPHLLELIDAALLWVKNTQKPVKVSKSLSIPEVKSTHV